MMWKEFSSYLSAKFFQLRTISPPVLSANNIFRFLLKEKFIKRLLGGVTCKQDCSVAAHLTSTRNLPAAGKKTIEKATKSFKTTVTTDFQCDLEFLKRVKATAARVARKIRRINPNCWTDAECHISLNKAGDYDLSVKDGGRATQMVADMTRVLTFAPDEDESLTLPNGIVLKTSKGVQRWKSWYREPEFLSDYRSFGEFNTPIRNLGIYMPDSNGDPEFIPDKRYGMDEALGPQILAVALLCASDEGYIVGTTVTKPIPTRTSVVPEPGVKARVVTATKWWNIILQQSPGNLIRAVLRNHPSAEAGLVRADQAWLYCDMLSKIALKGGFTKLSLDHFILSSDLAEATDRSPHPISRALLEGFSEGFDHKSFMFDLATNLVCSSRLVETSDGDSFITVRGAMMGEPMTKAILTLQSLVAEEMAIRDYLKQPDGPINVPWRCFTIGGDDHTAMGPRAYLDLITQHQVNLGSKISESKHGVSRLAVKYCEKVMFFKGTDLTISASKFNEGDNYESAVFVDSVKVRLLSPVGKSIEVKNDRNIAIGKAISIGKTLRWLNVKHFPSKWIQMVRNRFVLRMKSYLPSIGTSLFSQILLPQCLGGLDLYLKGELPLAIRSSPLPTIEIVCDLVAGQVDLKRLALLSSFVSNDVSRDVTVEHRIKENYETFFMQYSKNVDEIRNELGLLNQPFRKVLDIAKSRGFVPLKDALEISLRGLSMTKLLDGKGPSSAYNTRPWKQRYYDLWSKLWPKDYTCKIYTGNMAERIEGLGSIERYIPMMMVNLNQEIQVPSRNWSGRPIPNDPDTLTIRSAIDENSPSLMVGLNSILPLGRNVATFRKTREFVAPVWAFYDTDSSEDDQDYGNAPEAVPSEEDTSPPLKRRKFPASFAVTSSAPADRCFQPIRRRKLPASFTAARAKPSRRMSERLQDKQLIELGILLP